MRVATHNPIGQNNKCSLWTLYQYEVETGITDTELMTGITDGKYIDNNSVVIIKANKKYNTSGQRIY